MLVDEYFVDPPMLIAKHKAPTVSPMGITVFEKDSASDEWIVGSFSGLYRWNIMSGRVVDYFSHKPNKHRCALFQIRRLVDIPMTSR